MKRFTNGWTACLLLSLLFIQLACPGIAPADETITWVGRLVSIQGSVEIKPDGKDAWEKAEQTMPFSYVIKPFEEKKLHSAIISVTTHN